ncbi:PorV/PorQ family protein [Rhodocaloribacter litoris]|uniref:PorV/PorQ family protein n=1 Tax=Rhodocaloribacter litoris TaxID=2558931 RepID=UPI0014211F2F|nr:PorV/PorQ family protein [Rhodocaloribacter litoris]QXD16561.1 PorV/PorQ family protein [Rhodocaloribacter litoris]GIV59538.1 MAG: hypothetical protein KatS3mg043_0627 [Rhodothermaceae bacterium]
MKRCFHAPTLTFVFALLLVAPAFAQRIVTPDTEVETKKRAQTGMKFLTVSVDARATALGGAVMSDMAGSSTSLFYNPASMAGMPGSFHASAGMLSFITDINYNILSLAYRPGGGNYGVFGLSVVNVDYGDFIGTIRANNEAGFVETGNYSPTALAVGLGYARAFSDRFAAGIHIKYAYQNIGDDFVTAQDFDSQTGSSFNPGLVTATESYAKGTLAFDFGVVYMTGFRSLVIAMTVRNFAQEQTYVRERFELPLTFQIGTSINLLDFTAANPDVHRLRLHVDAQRPRDFDEHIKFGLEYTFMDIFSLRGGFEQTISEEEGISLGAGVHHAISNIRFGADYAYTDWGLFGDVHRVGVQIGF